MDDKELDEKMGNFIDDLAALVFALTEFVKVKTEEAKKGQQK